MTERKRFDQIINEPNTFDEMSLDDMTDEWIEEGNYCDQTVIYLRDVCRGQRALIKAVLNLLSKRDK